MEELKLEDYQKRIEQLETDLKEFKEKFTQHVHNGIDTPQVQVVSDGLYVSGFYTIAGTGDVSITQNNSGTIINFKPSRVRLFAVSETYDALSYGTTTTTSQSCIFKYDLAGTPTIANDNSSVISIYDGTGAASTLATVSSFNSDGFTLTITTHSADVAVFWEVYA